MLKTSPTSFFWDMVLRLVTLVLVLVRAQRALCLLRLWNTLLLPLHLTTPIKPIHIRDLNSLPPPIKMEFQSNGFWAQNSSSSVPLIKHMNR